MAAYLNDRVLDSGLNIIKNEANVLHFCSSMPADYAGTLTASLGSKTSPTISSPAARSPSGRKVTVSAVTNAACTANGTITHWALVDSANSRLLAANTIAVSKATNNGDTITSAAFDVGIPGPA
ncbi:hypothetical protein LB523_12005 [Mesorhizobium sp. ESP-6-4]|uniref:hypothetical protein n=1 Tax=Mesorhizobium sp. ESP-6-4 TaxID=2876624 RepID=UPI001CCE92FC|nr:hypothetical protein [Mesorhizobium sp. ESP-6-4]MBZ9659769.1 hypothetical protein [Mesorhizobium sp. ESP-6-4]